MENETKEIPAEKPTLDQQIEYITQHQHAMFGGDDVMYREIKENLMAIKRWNSHKHPLTEEEVTDVSSFKNFDLTKIAGGIPKPQMESGKYEFEPKDYHQIKDIVYGELQAGQLVFTKFIESNAVDQIHRAAQLMISCIKQGGKLMSCGNGGSFSDAQHFASELSGKYRGVRPAIAALSLSDGGALTCIANDFGYSQVFKRQVEAIGRFGDVLLCLSTSGNSENILVAAERARMLGIRVVSICGNGGGKLKDYTDVLIEIPHAGTADRVQEMTIIIIHILVNLIERL
jgi:D-sedoheptulose 7-phosphate isomerase